MQIANFVRPLPCDYHLNIYGKHDISDKHNYLASYKLGDTISCAQAYHIIYTYYLLLNPTQLKNRFIVRSYYAVAREHIDDYVLCLFGKTFLI